MLQSSGGSSGAWVADPYMASWEHTVHRDDEGALVRVTMLRDAHPFWTYHAKRGVPPSVAAALAAAQVLDLFGGLFQGLASRGAAPTEVARLLAALRAVTGDLSTPAEPA